jgi:hypothetical protein
MAIELGEFLCWDPIFSVFRTSHYLNVELIQIVALDLELRNKSSSTRSHIPITRDLSGIFLVQYRPLKSVEPF